MKSFFLFLTVFLFLFSSCALNNAVVKKDYDFSQVKKVLVGDFSDSEYANSGLAIRSVFVKQLLAKGYNVVVDPVKADVIIEGSITAYEPDKKYLVSNSRPRVKGRRNTIVYNNQVMEIGGSNVYDLGTAFGMKNSRVIASNATVSLYAYMKDFKTGEIIWSDSYTYEGLDINMALEGAVKYILKSIPKGDKK